MKIRRGTVSIKHERRGEVCSQGDKERTGNEEIRGEERRENNEGTKGKDSREEEKHERRGVTMRETRK